jgi:DNA-binding ferritin-like protein
MFDPYTNATHVIADALYAKYPPNQPMLVPHQHVEALAADLTLLIAEILQAWVDAGSERDAVMEDLLPHIEAEVHGWSDHPSNLT